jgi:Family of unknown function (DUF6491)
MLRLATHALTLALALAATAAGAESLAARETVIPRMSRFLDWRPADASSLYVQAESRRWYLVRLQSACPRILNRANVRFNASPTDRLDRYSTIRADGWRCQISSITESGPPPGHERH